jgi:hypothetical protein
LKYSLRAWSDPYGVHDFSGTRPPAPCKEGKQDRFEPKAQGAGKVRFAQKEMACDVGSLRLSGLISARFGQVAILEKHCR